MKRIFLLLSLLFFCVSSFSDKSSIYEVKTTWKDQNSKEIRMADFKGHPIVLTMVYTSCPHACPMMVSRIRDIKKEFEQEGIFDVKYVLASFDVENDTPEHLKSYMNKRKLDDSSWTFLSAKNESAARELSVVLGINFKKLSDGNFSHSNVITLIDDQGHIVARIDKLSANTSHFKSALKK